MSALRVASRVLALPALAALLALHGARADEPADPKSLLEAFVPTEQARQGIPGIAIAVVQGDAVVWQRGFGVANVETGAPVTPETLFQIGSLTKTFTATAILAATEAGRFDPERPVGKYVTGLNPCVAAVTTEQLLRHRAGLKDEPDEYGPHDEGELLAYARSWGPDYCLLPPDTAYSYSNSGFALAGLTLQEALHQPYADAVKTLVFDPLGMKRTTFRPTEAMTYPFALGHRPPPSKPAGPSATVVRPVADDARLWPAGEIWTNAAELARFAIAFLNDGKLDGAQRLPAGLAAKLATPRTDVPSLGERYGYGLTVAERGGLVRVGHGGTMPGFSVMLKMIPARHLGVIVLTNLESAEPDRFADRALDAFLPEADRGAPPPLAPARAALPEGADRYLGSYTNPKRWTLAIAKNDRQLILKQFGREFPLEMVDERRFRFTFRDRPNEIVFGPLEPGGPAYVQFYVWAFARVRP